MGLPTNFVPLGSSLWDDHSPESSFGRVSRRVQVEAGSYVAHNPLNELSGYLEIREWTASGLRG